MSNGSLESDMWRPTLVVSSSSSRLSALKSLVPATQRDAMRAFFDRRVPSSNPPQGAQNLVVPGSPRDRKMSWREWAGDKIRGRGSNASEIVERISLFPGWAARRYHDPNQEGKEAAEFALEIFISGFAASYVPPESATRSQRAFMRLAKAYAALPKLPSPTSGPGTRPLSRSTEDLLKTVTLPPTPGSITEESEMAALEKQFQRAELDMETDSLTSAESDSSASSLYGTTPSSSPAIPPGVSYATASGQFMPSMTDLIRLHENLNARLHPFWSRSLPNRQLCLSVYSAPPRSNSYFPLQDNFDDNDATRQPIFRHQLSTDAQGSFEATLRIPWERICVHPGALRIAFGDMDEDYELYICAELRPPFNSLESDTTRNATTRTMIPVNVSHSQLRLISDIDDTIKLSNILGGARAVFRNVFVRQLEELVIQGMGDWYTRMWSRGVRFHYVSNSPFELLPVINEFIKVSNLPRGSIKLRSYAGRSLFNGLLSTPATRKRAGIVDILNAFSSSRFILVGDSGEQDLELYAQLAAERHNQILAVFIRDARGPNAQPIPDPTGEEIKRCPPPSRTASVSSEMDLPTLTSKTSPGKRPSTLPTSLDATPTQKSYSRMNASASSSPSCLDNPTQDYMSIGAVAPRMNGKLRSSSNPPSSLAIPPTFFDSSFTISTSSSPTPSRPASPSSSSTSTSMSTLSSLQFPGSLTETEVANLSAAEKKRYKFQERVYRARLLMPSHIPLRVFTNPEECVEADRILDNVLPVENGVGSSATAGKVGR